jgi:hypothetical protein
MAGALLHSISFVFVPKLYSLSHIPPLALFHSPRRCSVVAIAEARRLLPERYLALNPQQTESLTCPEPYIHRHMHIHTDIDAK